MQRHRGRARFQPRAHPIRRVPAAVRGSSGGPSAERRGFRSVSPQPNRGIGVEAVALPHLRRERQLPLGSQRDRSHRFLSSRTEDSLLHSFTVPRQGHVVSPHSPMQPWLGVAPVSVPKKEDWREAACPPFGYRSCSRKQPSCPNAPRGGFLLLHSLRAGVMIQESLPWLQPAIEPGKHLPAHFRRDRVPHAGIEDVPEVLRSTGHRVLSRETR
jgi:hypothetical protein